ncbi:MAG TPA: methyltransferase domain-containing protein [Chthoniobacterales bacterium]|nr:methyltransferase domain-containing protein [Chthoniobacterales bacterium]
MDRYLARLYIRRSPLTWAFDTLKSQGLRGTLSSIVRAFVDVRFDIRYGTDTARWVEIDTLRVESEHKKDALTYIPTQVTPLRTVLRKLDLPKDGVFVDLGSGKGRVLLIAAQSGFQRIIGVEFSRELCEIARENVKAFLRKTQIEAQIEVIESDVATWPIDRRNNVFFMFHPFKINILARFLEHLHSSLTQFPRKIWLILNNPTDEEDKVLGGFRLFGGTRELKPDGASYPFRVYHNGTTL